jgi:hypothetical protein
MKKYTQAVRPGFAVLAVALLSFAPMLASARVTKDSPEFSGFLAQARSEAVQVQRISEEMYTFSNISWQTQAAKLDELKTHVNKLGEFVVSMNKAEAPSPWQQNAISELTPLVQELAGNVTMAVYHLDATRDTYGFSSFPEYVAANAELAPEITQMISDYVAYDEAKQKAKETADELQRARWSRGHFED